MEQKGNDQLKAQIDFLSKILIVVLNSFVLTLGAAITLHLNDSNLLLVGFGCFLPVVLAFSNTAFIFYVWNEITNCNMETIVNIMAGLAVSSFFAVIGYTLYLAREMHSERKTK